MPLCQHSSSYFSRLSAPEFCLSGPNDGNGLYLNEPFWTDQALDYYKSAYWRVLGIYKLIPHLQNLRDKGRIDGFNTEIIQLHKITKAASRGLYRGLYVAKNLLSLREKVFLANQVRGFV
jgi:hypothetical protein